MLYYIVIKLVYSLIIRGWHNRAHTSIDTLHGNKYSLAISHFLFIKEFNDFRVSNTQFAHLNKLSE